VEPGPGQTVASAAHYRSQPRAVQVAAVHADRVEHAVRHCTLNPRLHSCPPWILERQDSLHRTYQ
jgi:hypothetical protein